jgi:hypothetical protein
MAWDKLEIQQSIKEQTLEASVLRELPLLTPTANDDDNLLETQADSEVMVNTETTGAEEAPKKKSRRRHRRRKVKGAEPASEGSVPDDPMPPTVPETPKPPVPSTRSARFPAKPLQIIRALPEEFYPVDLEGDLFAPEPAKDDSSDDSED